MPTVPSGSTKKSVPSPPDQPMRPRWGPAVFTATPKPHPMPSQKPGKKLSAVLHAAGKHPGEPVIIRCGADEFAVADVERRQPGVETATGRLDLHQSLVTVPV